MDFFARLNQISLHRSTNFFVVTKLDSSEPTWAGEDGAKVEQVFSFHSQTNRRASFWVFNSFLVSLQSVHPVVQSEEEGVQ